MYMATAPNGVYWLDLVQTPDHRLTGEFEEILLKPDGNIDYTKLSVTGAASGTDVSLALAATPLPFVAVTAAGTLGWGKLTLTAPFNGREPGTVVFQRSDLQAHQRVVDTLNARSRAMLAEKAQLQARRDAEQREQLLEDREQVVIQQLTNLTESLRRAVAVPLQEDAFRAAEERYRAITLKLQDYLNREQRLANNPNAAVVRSQISVAINQGTIATEQAHMQIEGSERDAASKLAARENELQRAEQVCREQPAASSSSTESAGNATTRASACAAFYAVREQYRQKIAKLESRFRQMEAAYQHERAVQAQILRVSEQLQ